MTAQTARRGKPVGSTKTAGETVPKPVAKGWAKGAKALWRADRARTAAFKAAGV